MTLKLEVGKTYVAKPVQILSVVNDPMYPFLGDNGESYTKDGRYSAASHEGARNLVSEAPQPSPETPTERILTSGLTLREHFAGLALQGIASNKFFKDATPETWAMVSAQFADALIAALEGRG